MKKEVKDTYLMVRTTKSFKTDVEKLAVKLKYKNVSELITCLLEDKLKEIVGSSQSNIYERPGPIDYETLLIIISSLPNKKDVKVQIFKNDQFQSIFDVKEIELVGQVLMLDDYKIPSNIIVNIDVSSLILSIYLK